MPLVIYLITASILLYSGLVGLSEVLPQEHSSPRIALEAPAPLVPTTAAEMAAQARRDAAAIQAAFKKVDPPPVLGAASLLQPSAAVAPGIAAKGEHPAADRPRYAVNKKKTRTARYRHDLKHGAPAGRRFETAAGYTHSMADPLTSFFSNATN
jgi:hypothetical protein